MAEQTPTTSSTAPPVGSPIHPRTRAPTLASTSPPARAPAVALATPTSAAVKTEYAQLEERRVQRLREANEVVEALKGEIEDIEKGEEDIEKEEERLRAEKERLRARKKARMADVEKVVMDRERGDEEDRSSFWKRMGWGI